MLWKVLVPLCLLSLSGLASEVEDADNIGKNKLLTIDTESSTQEWESTTENYEVEVKTESLIRRKNDKAKSERKEEEEKKNREVAQVLTEQTLRNMLNTSHVLRLLQNTWLRFYRRNSNVEVVKSTGWFSSLDPGKDLVILVHGATKSQAHVDDFFGTLSNALLNETDYNIIAVDWTEYVASPNRTGHLATNIYYAKLLGIMLTFLFEKHIPGFFTNTLNTYYIGEGIATVPPITFEERFSKPFQYVYGLNPKKDMPHPKYRLAQEHGEVVAILTTNNYPYTYGHKNVHPVPFGASLPPVHKTLAKAIVNGRRTGTFCPTANHFTHGYCDTLPHVPVWFTHVLTSDKYYPTGNYYFYEFDEKEKCDPVSF